MVTTGLLAHIKHDHPQIDLQPSDGFLWMPDQGVIRYSPSGNSAYLLHELGHALLGHNHYKRDIELLSIERAAWTYANSHLAPRYGVTIDADLIEDSLDSYRQWLHDRSTCPRCNLNGLQTGTQSYRCVSCHITWNVNEAKGCRLLRYTTN